MADTPASKRWRRVLAVVIGGVLVAVAVGVVAIHETLTAVTSLFGHVPEVVARLETKTRFPLANGSTVTWQGRDVARLTWYRRAAGIGGMLDSLRVLQGEWAANEEPVGVQSLAGDLVSFEGEPPTAHVRLLDSAEVSGGHMVGQLWIGRTVLWLFSSQGVSEK